MLVLKGSLLGILMFCILFVIAYRRLFRSIVHPTVYSAIIHDIFFWLGLVGCILVGCTIARWFWWHPPTN